MKIAAKKWQGWEVNIVDKHDTTLPEYNQDSWLATATESAYTSLYVECKDEQQFAIVVRQPTSKMFDARIMVKIDGHLAMNIAFTYIQRGQVRLSTVTDLVKGVAYDRTLVFCPLKRTGDGPKMSSTAAQQLGTIEVILTKGKFRPHADLRIPTTRLVKTSVVDEKIKKGRLTSCVGGVGLTPSKPVYHNDFTPANFPEYRVVFNYATRPALEFLEVAPPKLSQSLHHAETGRTVAAGVARKIKKESQPRAAADNDIIPIESPKKRRKIEVVDLSVDSDGEDKQKPNNMEKVVGDLMAEVKLLREQLQQREKREAKEKKKERYRSASRSAGPSKRRR